MVMLLRPCLIPSTINGSGRITVAIALGLFAVNLDFFAVQTALRKNSRSRAGVS
jgi:hypothetical protein